MSEIILPDYSHCILNLITSILKYYNVKTEHKTLENVDNILKNRYKNIVFIILDGMGEHILEKASPKGYLKSKDIDCLTSVYPSTTTAALTTYYSGRPPYETGWIAWSQYFKEYGRAIDMFSHRQSLNGGEIKKAKKDVFKEILNYQTVFERIEEASPQIKAYEIMPTYAEKKSKRSIRADSIEEIITKTLKSAEKYGACIPVVDVKDTIKEVDSNGMVTKTLKRSSLCAVQTPQTFEYNLIKQAYENLPPDLDVTDDASVVEISGGNVKIVEGSYDNIKITTIEDLDSGLAILKKEKANEIS